MANNTRHWCRTVVTFMCIGAGIVPTAFACGKTDKKPASRLSRGARHVYLQGSGSAQGPPPPLTPKQKLLYATENSVDPLAWIEATAKAGFYQATGFRSRFGSGLPGYGKQLGASLADGASENVFGGFVFPTLLHQDPRYFPMGHGRFRNRLVYALSRAFVTRSDSGREVFNWSSILSSASAAGLSNTYYPSRYRTPGITAENFGWFLVGEAANNLIEEFTPKLYRHLSGRRH